MIHGYIRASVMGMWICMYACVYVGMRSVRLYICIYVWIHGSMHVDIALLVCMYLCMYKWIYVCTCSDAVILFRTYHTALCSNLLCLNVCCMYMYVRIHVCTLSRVQVWINHGALHRPCAVGSHVASMYLCIHSCDTYMDVNCLACKNGLNTLMSRQEQSHATTFIVCVHACSSVISPLLRNKHTPLKLPSYQAY